MLLSEETVLVLTSSFLTASGVLIAWIGLRRLLKFQRARNWRRVEGLVVAAHVRHSWEGCRLPVLKYEYTVDDVRYAGSRILAGGEDVASNLMEKAFALIDSVKKGDKVPVWCDPHNPREAFLIHSVGSAPWLVVFGMLMLTSGIMLAVTYT